MFFELHQYEKALVSAIESNDTNIVFSTLFAIKSSMIPRDNSDIAKQESEEQFLNLIVKVPAACSLLESYLNRTQWRKRRVQKIIDSNGNDFNGIDNAGESESGIFDGQNLSMVV